MENSIVVFEKDGEEKEDSSLKNTWPEFSRFAKKDLLCRAGLNEALLSSIIRSRNGNRYLKSASARGIHDSGGRIPRHLVTLDEIYLRRCVELIHISASKETKCNIPSVFQCSVLPTLTANAVLRPSGLWIIDSFRGSKASKNPIVRHPFQCIDAAENNGQYIGSDENHGDEDSACCELTGSPIQQSVNTLAGLARAVPSLEILHSTTESVKGTISLASTSSQKSDDSTSSATAASSQGMLHCTWKDGMPQFVLSIDDQREIYIADSMKVESSNHQDPDYVYLLYSKKHVPKEHVSREERNLIGKMEVVTSMSLCRENFKIMETEFVLFGGWDNFQEEGPISAGNLGKKGLAKKVVGAFRHGRSSKQRSMSGKSGTLENYTLEASQDMLMNLDKRGGYGVLDNYLPHNLEMTAIVVKNCVEETRKEEIGGWGLKFLRKDSRSRNVNSSEGFTSECSDRNTGDCSTSMEVIVPAGLHGGPRTRINGPSSLIERWKSGGQCDCGGWDLGCPLTLFKAGSNRGDILSHGDMRDCKSFDLYGKGSEHYVPTLRMMDVRDGLYHLQFNSALSALQSFSIAIARIHTQSRILQLIEKCFAKLLAEIQEENNRRGEKSNKKYREDLRALCVDDADMICLSADSAQLENVGAQQLS